MAEYDAAIAELELAITELRLSIRKDVSEALLDINIAKTHYLSNVERTKLNRERLRAIKVRRKVNQATESDVALIRREFRQSEVDQRVSAIDLIHKTVIYHLKIGKILLKEV